MRNFVINTDASLPTEHGLEAAVAVIFDPSVAPSGAYRALRPVDLTGGGSGSAMLPASISGSTGYVNSFSVQASQLFQVLGFNGHSGVQYMQIFNGAATLANLLAVIPANPSGNFFCDFNARGVTVSNSITVINSLQPNTI